MKDPKLTILERDWGISLDGAQQLLRPEYARNYNLAMDAQPALVTTASNGIPAFLATFVDPELLVVATSKNAATEILGEVRKGSFADIVAMFPVVEQAGDVSSYGDYNNNGQVQVNVNYPQRQSYLYQTIVQYGDLELERAGLAKIGWAAQKKEAAVNILNKYQNKTYFYGVSGLQNYGLLNDPNLYAPIAPAVKTYGNVNWITNGAITASANEVYADCTSLFTQVVSQSGGLVDKKARMKLCMSPTAATALTATNQFNVNVEDLLKKNFPNLEVVTAVQYGAVSSQNPEGSVGGEVVQLIVESVEGQEVGYCAFNEKLRGGAVIRDLSSYKQKMAQGSYGAVIRQPFLISQMIGV
jgi:hypothetical protein